MQVLSIYGIMSREYANGVGLSIFHRRYWLIRQVDSYSMTNVDGGYRQCHIAIRLKGDIYPEGHLCPEGYICHNEYIDPKGYICPKWWFKPKGSMEPYGHCQPDGQKELENFPGWNILIIISLCSLKLLLQLCVVLSFVFLVQKRL